MRVAYVGDFERSWTTETHVADAFVSLGHDVFFVQSTSNGWGGLFDVVDQNGVELVVFSARPLRNDEHHGTAGIEALRRRGVKTASYHLDLYFGLYRMIEVGRASWWKADFVFTADGGSPEHFWRGQGVNHYWLPAAIPRPEIYRAEPDGRFRAKIAFVGSKNYLTEWGYRRELLSWLSTNYGDDFRIFPGDGPRIHGDDLNRLYASVDVVIGDTLSPNFAHDFYWSDRIYQTLGRGGVLIHPKIGGLDREYRPGVEFVQYGYGDYIVLRREIGRLLEDSEAREAMRKSGAERSLEAHTFEHRVSAILDRVFS